MLQVSNFRLFFFFFSTTKHSISPSLLSHPFKQSPPKPLSLFTTFAASRPPKFHSSRGRNNSTLSKSRKVVKEGGGGAMEEESSKGAVVAGFNKRRAEGRDKDKPKALQLKARKLNPANTTAHIQILGTGMDTQDTAPSVLLFFDKQRIIFNAGEGLQRYCTEHKIKLSKVNIWGPSDLKYLVDAMRSFIPNAAMVHTHSFGPAPKADGAPTNGLGKFSDPIVLIDDEVVKISAILIKPGQMEDDSTMVSSSASLDMEIDQFLGPILPHSKNPERNGQPVLKPGDISVIYICELPEINGKFDTAKAMALGLKPGPKYRDLQLGKSVMSDKQNVMVHPSDVLGPSVPGPIILLVDCPTLSHLQELWSIQSLNCYFSDLGDQQLDDSKSVNCIIHLSPSSVTKTATYQKWMERFGGAQHIMAGRQEKNMEIPILKASARVAARLNYLCPQFFPASGFWSLQHPDNLIPESNSSFEGTPKLCDNISAENLLKFHLRPYSLLGLDRSGIPRVSARKEIVDELISEIPDVVDSVEQVRQLWDESVGSRRVPTQKDVVMVEEPWMNANASIPDINLGMHSMSDSGEEAVGLKSSYIIEDEHEHVLPSCLEDISREDMEIVFLGTGSSQPSKYRNVSSIYLNLFSKGGLLLDCGEGTLGQLTRRYGVKGANASVKGLRCIWISHIHADHHTGLARILALRSELLRGVPHEPILVIGPRQLKRFLDAYRRLEDLDMQFLDCRHTTKDSLAVLESSLALNGSHSIQGSPDSARDMNKLDTTQNIQTSLFAKGSPMQSYWKKPNSPVDTAAGIQNLKNLKKVLEESGLETLVSVPVVHCPQAFGLVLKAAERNNTTGKTIPGWKLVYSGDTRPCPELIEASRGATVLIHEATFEEGMVEEAIAKNHSTTMEAIEVGDSAGAYRIILTHFSQRYPKIPVFDDTHMHKTCIAFDLMSINIADLPVIPKVLPYLKLLFINEMMAVESDDASLL